MILLGSKKKGRHLLNNISKSSKANSKSSTTPLYGEEEGALSPPNKKQKWSLKKKLLLISGIVSAVAIGVIIVVVSLSNWVSEARETAPPVRAAPFSPEFIYEDRPSGGAQTPVAPSEEEEDDSIRDTTKYTFLVLGTDGSNTDSIMIVKFDSDDLSLDVVNIPRDTMVNVRWSLRKANSIHANMRIRHRGEENAEVNAMDSTLDAFADILGFKVDFWIVVNMRAFVSLIDAIGGVDFYVPANMRYNDNFGGLHINYNQGMHYGLSGKEALEILRFRRFASADIGRISVQQSFLQAAAEQIIAKRDSLNVMTLAETFLTHVVTDIPLDNLVWFGERFLQLDPENINFHVMPGNPHDSVSGGSYVSIYVDEWLELINEVLNPFRTEITIDDVSILTRGPDRRLYVTDGNWQGSSDWGASSRGPSTPGSTTPGSLTTNSGEPAQGNNPAQGNPPTVPGNDPDDGDDPQDIDDDPPDNVDDPPDNIATPPPGDVDPPPSAGTDPPPDDTPGSDPPPPDEHIDEGTEHGPGTEYTPETTTPQG